MSLNSAIMAEKIRSALERFGTKNFKGVGHKIMTEVMHAGALGIEIIMSGKIPGSRAKSWRFFSGYLRKCGDVALEQIDKAEATANLKSGVVGIKVAIMPPNIKLPDVINIIEEKQEVVEETASKEQTKGKKSEEKKKKKEKSSAKKRSKKKDKEEKKPEEPKEEKDKEDSEK